jgi:isopentenyl-diphosphate delta-isomerase
LNTKIIVKEVGQGMGPHSLKALLDLPIAGIELAGFGGTNFTKLELLRNKNEIHLASGLPMSKVGHTTLEMVNILGSLMRENLVYQKKQIIISGGVENTLDGLYLQLKLGHSSVIGQAKNYLVHAENYDDLREFTLAEISTYRVAKKYLRVREKGFNS